jgi:hypothetical protein
MRCGQPSSYRQSHVSKKCPTTKEGCARDSRPRLVGNKNSEHFTESETWVPVNRAVGHGETEKRKGQCMHVSHHTQPCTLNMGRGLGRLWAGCGQIVLVTQPKPPSNRCHFDLTLKCCSNRRISFWKRKAWTPQQKSSDTAFT